MWRTIPALAFLLVCTGCGSGSGEDPRPAQRVSGFLVEDGERLELRPCGAETAWRVDGPALPELRALRATIVPEGDSSAIFVDVLARPSDSAPQASQSVLEVRRAAFEGFGCRAVDDRILARAGGNEPFWSVEVHRDRATFSTPEGGLALEAGPLERVNGGWRVSGSGAGGGAFTFTLEPGGCTDSMSGAWSHTTATFTRDSETYTGCGFLGPAGEP